MKLLPGQLNLPEATAAAARKFFLRLSTRRMAVSSGNGIGRGATAAVAAVLRKVRIRAAVSRTTIEFFRNTSLHGFRDLAVRSVHWMDKFILSACLLTFLGWALSLILIAWAAYTSNPIYVSRSSNDNPIEKVPFPGIAICPNNKLSKSSVQSYAELLSNKTQGAVSSDLFLEQLRYLGRLVDFEVDGYDNFPWLQNYLDNYDVEPSATWYDTYKRMKQLSPHCKDLLLHCMWEGVERDCGELFQWRVTQEGFCCTFNYIRSDIAFPNQRAEPIKTRFYGIENGLQLILNQSEEDYYYPLLNQHGHTVLVFQPHDFPDMVSGSMEQRFSSPNENTMLELFTKTLDATESLRWFSPEIRGCFFRDEPKGYNGFYSQSECFMNCRVRSFVDLCDCIPFFIPRLPGDPLLSNNTQTCNLEHVQCLNKYQFKMRTYYPVSGNITGLEKELQDSIVCGQCLPLCNHVSYSVGTVSVTLQPEAVEALARDKLGRNDTPPLSVVKIYHARRKSSLYVQDVVSEWFNMLSSYGGQIGLCIGFSFLNVVEFFYFYTWRLWRETERLYHKSNDKDRGTRKVQPFQQPLAIEWLSERPFYNADTDRYFLR